MSSPKQKRYNPPLLKFVSFASLIYLIYYLWWRITYTFSPEFPFFSWVLWLAELFGVFSYGLFAWFTRDIAPIVLHKHPKQGLKVDIFIPTYNEEEDILEATLIGCQKIRYPHITYVLDDGKRPHVKKLAERLGCQYIARPTNEHAKAGNINYALKNSNGDFIAILDADMIPQPGYLDRTLGYFDDKNLALIQLPQEFYNQDSIQHASNLPAWHEQSLFFHIIQPGKNHSNSAFWCGSPSVVRRRALESIGGVATETITEDIHTTVRLHSRGWKTLYVNEPLAYGIAPQTIQAFLLQRLRWAQGTMQLYRSKESPLWIPGLTLEQRLSYLASFFAYFEAFQKATLLTIPILILAFDIFPMRVDAIPFLIHWAPYFALNIFANQIGGRGVFQYFKTEKYNILKTVIFIESTLTLISKKPLKFKVTPKMVDDTVYEKERRSMRWYMILFGGLVGSMIYALVKSFLPHSHSITWDAFFIAIFWASYNAYVVLSALMEVFQKKHDRRYYRFPVNAQGEIYDSGVLCARAQITDLSTSGVGMLAEKWLPTDSKRLTLKLHTPDVQHFKDISLPIEMVKYQHQLDTGRYFAGARFLEDLGAERELLFAYLFIHMPHMNNRIVYTIIDWDPVLQIQALYRRLPLLKVLNTRHS